MYLIDRLRSYFWAVTSGIIVAVIALAVLPCVEEPLDGHTLSDARAGKSIRVGKTLIIGVLSAQNNTHHRQVIRETWGRLIDREEVDLKFIVGSTFCPIPTIDRVTPYLCEEWNPVTPEDGKLESSVVIANNRENVETSHLGFTFTVKQNISVEQLSLSSSVLTSTNHIARVVLIDAFLGKILASATFAFDPEANVEHWRTKKIHPVRLPAFFEGELRIITSNPDCACPFELETPSAVHVFEFLDSSGSYSPASNETRTVCGGFAYTVEDGRQWRSHLETKPGRFADWKAKQESVKSRLVEEHDKHGDILFVGVVDVYANLMWKTLYFLEWASSRGYDFVLKTDDDVFLDVPKIVEELQKEPEHGWDWWSCFRVGWHPPNAGKWRDRLTKARTYPPFPSGLGYVIRREAVGKLMARPNPDVPVGEDVAVGLLADGLNLKPLLVSVCYWACDENRPQTPCNAPERHPETMKTMWQSYNNCSGISASAWGAVGSHQKSSAQLRQTAYHEYGSRSS